MTCFYYQELSRKAINTPLPCSTHVLCRRALFITTKTQAHHPSSSPSFTYLQWLCGPWGKHTNRHQHPAPCFTFSPSSPLHLPLHNPTYKGTFFYVFSSLHARHVLQIQMQTCTTLGWTHKGQMWDMERKKKRLIVPTGWNSSQIVLSFSMMT